MFYIRMNAASPQNWYWNQNWQNWTSDHTQVTLFATRDEADIEAKYAEAYGPGEVMVLEKAA